MDRQPLAGSCQQAGIAACTAVKIAASAATSAVEKDSSISLKLCLYRSPISRGLRRDQTRSPPSRMNHNRDRKRRLQYRPVPFAYSKISRQTTNFCCSQIPRKSRNGHRQITETISLTSAPRDSRQLQGSQRAFICLLGRVRYDLRP